VLPGQRQIFLWGTNLATTRAKRSGANPTFWFNLLQLSPAQLIVFQQHLNRKSNKVPGDCHEKLCSQEV
jgi:hypothetical protein